MTEISAAELRLGLAGGFRPSGPAPLALDQASQAFETVFLAEMLKHAGLGRMPEGLNGGVGEAAFSGLLTWEYAAEIARTGRTGLGDRIAESLRQRGAP